MAFKKNISVQKQDFDAITISLSSPDDILERSYGEVLKPETINYRSYKPERDGLFCERIFGPVKDYECYCGKYKRIRYKGIVCDRCGVEVTEKKVRRERNGHIRLVVPVVHIWFFKSLPNKIAYLLGFSSKNLESIIYYERYVVINPGIRESDEIMHRTLITEEQYLDILETLPPENQQLEDGHPDKFVAKMGAEAVRDLLEGLELDSLSDQLRHQASTETSQQRKSEALKRLRVVEAFRDAQKNVVNKPEWTIIQYLPVVPPELRPLVPLDGGRFASSDLNDLYRRVIIRNNRLKRLLEIKAPEVILRNEKRMLQEAVDSLFDNSRKSNAVKAEGGRALKSLSDILKGKQGRFRQNLLGKRVDYSGRSVIVVGPTLKLHECGLPKGMAAELFKPFVIRKLIERGIVKTVKSAKKLVDRKEPVIWEILENILKGHPVMLNRAPTLHRLSIQAFQPKLIEGKAIQLHPLVCSAFNADFDGDQMAVHVPLSQAAILEAQVLMLSSHNMLNPQNGTPVTLPSQDMVLGLYYITKNKKSTDEVKVKGEGGKFYSPEEVMIAYNEGKLDLHATIHCRVPMEVEAEDGTMSLKKKLVETTTGRIIFNSAMPATVPYQDVLLTKKNLKKVIGDIIDRTSFAVTAIFLDKIKDMGFHWAFKGGLSFNLGDLITPSVKSKVLIQARAEVDDIQDNYNMGLITNNERYNKVIDKWTSADNEITTTLMQELAEHKQGFNSVYMMLHSGARGSTQQIKQLCGLRGLMAKPKKSNDAGPAVIENPILSNFVDGLSVLEYFISTHGARKGLADTALKTADAGYLTRRLVDVAQDVVVMIPDCGTLRGIDTSALRENDKLIESLESRIAGRYALDDILHPVTDEVIVEADAYIDQRTAKYIEAEGVEEVTIRSVLTCEVERGVCAKCYGKNLASGRKAEIGDAVGIIAAQSIGEPGTQLTLRTFHVGGTASVTSTDNNLESKFNGKVSFEDIRTVDAVDMMGDKQTIVLSRSGEMKISNPETGKVYTTQYIPYGGTLFVEDGQTIKKGERIVEWDPYNAVIVSEFAGIARYSDIDEGVTFRTERDELTGFEEKVVIETRDRKRIPTITIIDKDGAELRQYNLPVGAYISVKDGADVALGEKIVKIPRKGGKIADITGGLPRVTELFEARNPSNPAVVSEIDGIVTFSKKIKRGNRELIVEAKDGQKRKYLINLSKHILVQDQDFVRAGMPLSDGAIAPRDILDIKGPFAVQTYLVNGVQEVYRSQGITINNKHIETICRQMMRRVQIVDQGDTTFLEGEAIERYEFFKQNDWIYDKKVINEKGDSDRFREGKIVTMREVREENSRLKRNDMKIMTFRDAQAATSFPLLQGITKSSLGTPSWISAASFQETTKVLSTAAIAAKQDFLEGLKENVIVGKRIPAGTGMRKYDRLFVTTKEAQDQWEARQRAFAEEEAAAKAAEEASAASALANAQATAAAGTATASDVMEMPTDTAVMGAPVATAVMDGPAITEVSATPTAPRVTEAAITAEIEKVPTGQEVPEASADTNFHGEPTTLQTPEEAAIAKAEAVPTTDQVVEIAATAEVQEASTAEQTPKVDATTEAKEAPATADTSEATATTDDEEVVAATNPLETPTANDVLEASDDADKIIDGEDDAK
ncbi:DNA-directed RNA polymerase subunit beta' [Lewinella antarctica]|uniref:DNA-directed RNA polymerase subunit beta' n=1 Tax=Neolewinella antarctica TaxID=442734 RepID=A0ABX0X861_9BACT|nr:DNA-directed RNA polymerase subunit beta' [Neolewinella antarctica]NJC25434.1 DNA-directed RNA polymerase subunit beta' [Neolewinella antarctica]